MKNKFKIILTVLATIVVTASAVILMLGAPSTSESTVVVNGAGPTEKSPQGTGVTVTKKSVKRLKLRAEQVLYFDVMVDAASVKLAISILEVMTKNYDDIYLLIDSPGGSVFDGLQLISYIEASPKRIHTVCVSLCASMAAHLHASGKTRLMFDNAVLMYHPAAGGGGINGQVENMESQISMIKTVVDKLDAKIVSRSNLNYKEFKSRVAFEYWVLSDEALAKKLTDGIAFITTDRPEMPFGVSLSTILSKLFILDTAEKAEVTKIPEIK